MAELIPSILNYYHIDQQIGLGGMATVYQAYDTRNGRAVALKVVARTAMLDDRRLEDFRRESELMHTLRHPHILYAEDYGEAEGFTYIVMKLIENGTLANRLHGSPWPLQSAGKVIEHIGAALAFAHSQGVVHLDVKPSNILIDEAGDYLLADFGISKFLMAERSRKSIEVVGTPSYMSPEQCRGEPGDERSDIYSLGVVLYELITGRLPFSGATKEEVMRMQVQAPPAAPRRLNPQVPIAMHKVIERVLDKNPMDRYASVTDMIDAVTMAITQAPQGEQSQNAVVSPARTASSLPKPTEIATAVVPQPLDSEEPAVYVYDGSLDVVSQVFARAAPKTPEQARQQMQLRKESAAKDNEAAQQRSEHFQDIERQRAHTLVVQKQRQIRQERLMAIAVVILAAATGLYAVNELVRFLTELLSK